MSQVQLAWTSACGAAIDSFYDKTHLRYLRLRRDFSVSGAVVNALLVTAGTRLGGVWAAGLGSRVCSSWAWSSDRGSACDVCVRPPREKTLGKWTVGIGALFGSERMPPALTRAEGARERTHNSNGTMACDIIGGDAESNEMAGAGARRHSKPEHSIAAVHAPTRYSAIQPPAPHFIRVPFAKAELRTPSQSRQCGKKRADLMQAQRGFVSGGHFRCRGVCMNRHAPYNRIERLLMCLLNDKRYQHRGMESTWYNTATPLRTVTVLAHPIHDYNTLLSNPKRIGWFSQRRLVSAARRDRRDVLRRGYDDDNRSLHEVCSVVGGPNSEFRIRHRVVGRVQRNVQTSVITQHSPLFASQWRVLGTCLGFETVIIKGIKS
ncbi:hypothetical protein BC826DRAFT_1173061 [Russula brevipes]|nr:hypothetical protein BC826DRAFT_1173061 [Russula brevipes]